MNTPIPPIFWFLFWVGLAVGILGFGFFMAIILHRGHMKTLAILRLYAEKGLEPPPAVLELLQPNQSAGAKAGRDAGIKAANFVGLLAAAGSGGGIAWWRWNQGGPQWVVYFFGAAAAFFAIRSVWFLLTDTSTSDR